MTNPETVSPDAFGPDSAGSAYPAGATRRVSADHPGVDELYGLLAYGQLSAFYRLTADAAAMAPTVRGKVAMAGLAATDHEHFELLRGALADRGRDIFDAMAPYEQTIEQFHASTTPSSWLESLVKAYIGDGLASDFHREIVAALPEEIRSVVSEALEETARSEFVVAEVRAAIDKTPQVRSRLALWARRLLGEAVTQAQYVALQSEALSELVIAAAGDINHLAELFDRIQDKHAQRMESLGLG
ncbi:ferritin-like fold-containing protein [Tomitella cavernea]|uniref:Ferritin-like fold-containing protein n=1 Tax=Tomitella cavernea TaxID=1387982 RepID=A0ABP9D000_9ACTN|nr:ferritin-like fold-containing protein [Tomitella cavernea]